METLKLIRTLSRGMPAHLNSSAFAHQQKANKDGAMQAFWDKEFCRGGYNREGPPLLSALTW